MKFFRKWLKPDPTQQSTVNGSEQAPVSVRVRSESEGEQNDDSSFSWPWADQADSSVFDTGSLKIEKSKDRNAVSHKTPDLEGGSLSNAQEDTSFDPYNTARFDTKKT